jgi:hypothetical protein
MLAATLSHLEKGWFDIALNQSEPADLASWWHYSRIFAAEVDQTPASALAAFRAGAAYPLSQAACPKPRNPSKSRTPK